MTRMETKPDHIVDLRNKRCPFTILELGEALDSAAGGDLLEVVLAGEAALEEIEIWCRRTGAGVVETTAGEPPRVYVRKP